MRQKSLYRGKHDDASLLASSKHSFSKWTFEEMVILRELYPDITMSIDDMAKALPNRSRAAIYVKAKMIKLPSRKQLIDDALRAGGVSTS